jgi:hypothetical protein
MKTNTKFDLRSEVWEDEGWIYLSHESPLGVCSAQGLSLDFTKCGGMSGKISLVTVTSSGSSFFLDLVCCSDVFMCNGFFFREFMLTSV